MTAIPSNTLNDEGTIPQVGFGVFQISPEDTARAVTTLLEAGYRHIDTAEMYENEPGVGEGICASGLDRGDVFVTSKLTNTAHRPDDTRRAMIRSERVRIRTRTTSSPTELPERHTNAEG